MLLVLFGQPHSGKSTLAKKISADHYIDGDDLRSIFVNTDYSREGRIKNLNRASDIAVYLDKKGYDVVLSLVYPIKEAREYLNNLSKEVFWVYLTYEGERGRENYHVKDFEFPTEERILSLDTSKVDVDECIKSIKRYIDEKSLS